mgnify:CR=1 FL=1
MNLKRLTPLGFDIEESLTEAKDEMKLYIDEIMNKKELENKKKFMDLEASMRRIGGSSFGG